MNRFQIPSPILEIETNEVNDFIYEYVTTMIPLEILTTEQFPEAETREHNGLMVIIYGIGGVLIFFIICTICYGCFMPEISDEQYSRFMRRQQADLQERMRVANTERQRNENDVENQENDLVNENLNRREVIREEDRRTRDFQRIQEGPFSGILETVSSAIRSHTEPKQLYESHEETYRRIDNRNTTRQELELSQSPISEKYEERVPSWEYFPDNVNPVNEPNQLCKEAIFIDENPCEKGNSSIVTLQNIDSDSPVHEERSQSSPTSPNVVRRRYSSHEATPRRST